MVKAGGPSEEQERLIAAAISVVTGIVFIAALSLTIDARSGSGAVAAALLLDMPSSIFVYPFTIQNVMWVMFAFGLGELWVRLRQSQRDFDQVKKGFLPEETTVMLRAQDLGPIYARVRADAGDGSYFLQRLVARTVLQFQSSRSISQANALLNSSLDLYQHEIDLRYNLLRYLSWFIPTLGFIGTVVGIAAALNGLGVTETVKALQSPDTAASVLAKVVKDLGVAFYTTLLALVQSAIIVFLMHIAQAREESSLNRTGQYCLDNLINRLYEK